MGRHGEADPTQAGEAPTAEDPREGEERQAQRAPLPEATPARLPGVGAGDAVL
jgi:hypothetical protein